jgi:Transposase DDE domain
MKTAKAIPTGGVRIAPLDRTCGRSSGNGSGTSDWLSPRGALTPHCARWSGHPQALARRRVVPSRIRTTRPTMDRSNGPLKWARAWGGRLGAETFVQHEDGTLRCPQGIELWLSETRQENARTQRLIFMAKDTDCASCPVRAACLGRTASGTRGRRVSAVRHRRITGVVLHPRPSVSAAAIRWNDVAGRQLRRSWMAHWRQQTVTVAALPVGLSPPRTSSPCRPLPPARELAGALPDAMPAVRCW